jgi:TolB-like protein/predicted Zn-dependent protease
VGLDNEGSGLNPKNFFAELKRRNVYKVAVAYAVVGWLVIQISSTVLPTFHAPEWVVQTLMVLVALGFPIALVLAWAFELTPEGIKRAEDVLPNESITRKTGRKLVGITIALSVIAAGMLVIQLLRSKANNSAVVSPAPVANAAAEISSKSIAVLPFDNLSSDKENAYFAEGIQDEILTRLAKIAALKVISRTSTQKYKSAPDNLRDIGKQLGVANLLEGSVQKIANAVHVNVQLIRAANDEHLWAESYNRKLDDVFAVEGEVAGAIAEQLNAKLSGAEKQEVAARPTNNPEAYDAYLHGLAFFERPDLLGADLRNAVESLEKAVRLDPNFALAWARLSNTHSSIFFGGDDVSAARAQAAHEALQKALRLKPDLLETQLAEAYYHYFIERDYDRARQIFGLVHQQSPNNSEAPLALALIARRQGRWDESLAHFQEAMELDPRNLRTLMWTCDTYRSMRQFQMALKFIDRALDIAPGDNGVIVRKVDIYEALGQLDQAENVIAQLHADARDISVVLAMTRQLLLRHNYPAGVALMQSSLPKLDPSQQADRSAFLFGLAQFQQLAGDAVGAKTNYTQSRQELESLLRQQPDNADLMSALALVDAGLGDKEAALQEADRAMAKLPASRDALVGPLHEEIRARVLARFGDKDRAITILQHLLAIPYSGWYGAPVTPALLRLDPDWDNLRDDPRFQTLIATPLPKDAK